MPVINQVTFLGSDAKATNQSEAVVNSHRLGIAALFGAYVSVNDENRKGGRSILKFLWDWVTIEACCSIFIC